MDITNENFVQELQEISTTIRDCDFIAIDTELSGLMRDRSLNRFDLPEERFAKSAASSRGYFIMQFGLSCFTRLNDLHYSNRTYNFYIFPQAHGDRGDVNRTFSLQAHAIQFLSEHGFDFNKLFKHGVSYLTFQEKKLLTAQLKADMKARSRDSQNLDSHGLPKFVQNSIASNCRDWLKKVKEFVDERKIAPRPTYDSDSVGRMSVQSESGGDTGKNFQPRCKEDTLELRDCSSHLKRHTMKRVLECLPLFESIEIEFKHSDEKNDIFLVVHYIDKKVKIEKEKQSLVVAMGFLEVLELVILNKKPIVGHNLHLDLIQIINQFMEPLNGDYCSFKETCHSLFPLIYDTKYIAHTILEADTLNNNQSRLNDLYCQLRDVESFPVFKIEHLGVFFDENQMAHQAGYDAYMSGYCFLALCESYLQAKRKYKSIPTNPNSIANHPCVVEEFANKIHLSYSYDYTHFDLCADEEEPDRNHVFYVEHPETWALEDLFQVFNQYGGVTASKVTKTSSLCALRDPTQSNAILKKARMLKENPANYKIFSYVAYMDSYKPKRTEAAGDNDMNVV